MNEQEKVNLSKRIESLKKNPLHYMSISSNELFHSNFWYWMFDFDKNILSFFLNDIVDINIEELKNITREEKKVDLTLHMKSNQVILIENKFKSSPRKEQLKEYQEKIKQDKNKIFKKGLITGILKPSFLEDEDIKEDWCFLSYKQIGEGLLKYLKSVHASTSKYKYIEDYANYVIELYDLLVLFLSTVKDELITKDNFVVNELEKIKLGDVLKKLNADCFCNYLRNLNNDNHVNIENSFYNKNAVLDCKYVKEIEKDKSIELGIQIQADKYRRFFSVVSKDIKKHYSLEEQICYLEKQGWFNSLEEDEKNYNTFSKDNAYLMKYQYFKLTDNNVEVLSKLIFEDMKRAKKMIENLFV